MKKNTLADLQRMSVFLDKVSDSLEDADRLLSCAYAGTQKWASEVDAWRKVKRKIIDCRDDG